MRIIISPAKKMNTDTDSLDYGQLPVLMEETEELLKYLKSLSYAEAKAVWNCNDKIAALNYERVKRMELYRNLTPAILSYEGLQYQHMAPSVFQQEEFAYIEEHLRILSGFYGILRPLDGIAPYRLEMQAKLGGRDIDSLYDYWGGKLAEQIFAETDCIINLASKEYSKCISNYLPKERGKAGVRFITCVFGERKGDQVIEKGTQVKMARGEMVRYMAERQIRLPEEIKGFNRLSYKYAEELSSRDTFVFTKKEYKL